MIMIEKNNSKRLRIKIFGPDQKGIIANFTQCVFQHGCNIEDIDQRSMTGHFMMNMLIDVAELNCALAKLEKELALLGEKMGMQVRLEEEFSQAKKNLAILVTKENHCLTALLSQAKSGKIKGEIKVIIANQPDLEPIAKKYKIPFYYIPSDKKKVHEQKVLKILDALHIDLVVLARYMQIVSPEFVFHYEGRIINIHPSLLPAFPGPRSYEQAHNKGVDFVGVTAHFATTDLDEGPIICQEAFRINKNKFNVTEIQKRGRAAEVKALCKAVQLFCANKLLCRRNKVYIVNPRRPFIPIEEE